MAGRTIYECDVNGCGKPTKEKQFLWAFDKYATSGAGEHSDPINKHYWYCDACAAKIVDAAIRTGALNLDVASWLRIIERIGRDGV